MIKIQQNTNNWSYIKYKKLEELWSWASFYTINKRDKDLNKIQLEIEELRKELFEPNKLEFKRN